MVLGLTSHLSAGHEVTIDNFSTSVSLAYKLLERKNPMTLLGTIKPSRLYIPDRIKVHAKEKKDEFSSVFSFTKEATLVSYIPKKKSVVLLSSSHPYNDVEDDETMEPMIILQYNLNKIGVDKLDEITKRTSCMRKTRRWAMNIFCNILDMILSNAFVAHKMAIDPRMSRLQFLWKLSVSV